MAAAAAVAASAEVPCWLAAAAAAGLTLHQRLHYRCQAELLQQHQLRQVQQPLQDWC
jgi:hypothetical protein